VNKTVTRSALVATLIAAPGAALAQSGPNFGALTGAIDFSSTQDMLLSVGALLVGLALVVMGIRKVIRFIR
jgi:hypothetical protein